MRRGFERVPSFRAVAAAAGEFGGEIVGVAVRAASLLVVGGERRSTAGGDGGDRGEEERGGCLAVGYATVVGDR